MKGLKKEEKLIIMILGVIFAGILIVTIVLCCLLNQSAMSTKKNKKEEIKVLDSIDEIPEAKETRIDLSAGSVIVPSNVGAAPAIAETPVPEVPAAEAGVPLTETADSYVIADSATRELTEEDLKNLTEEQISHARNEIYARHGRGFDDVALQTYFDGKSWYTMTKSAADFDKESDGILSEMEKKNASFIAAYEEKKKQEVTE